MIDQRPKILLVGAAHWGNPGLDYKSVMFDDMSAPGRQREIATCLEQLVRFAPTKVALEIMLNHEDEWNEHYRSYRADRFTLTANERHQLGFRLAAMAGHDRIYGIDWHDLEHSIGWDRAIAFAKDYGQERYIPFFTALEHESFDDKAEEEEQIKQTSVRDQLLGTNTPHAMSESHRVYMDLAQVGQDSDYVGAEVVLRWYERNMMMFVNISRLANSSDERVLVLVGGGHVPLLSHFLCGAGRFRLEAVQDYLA